MTQEKIDVVVCENDPECLTLDALARSSGIHPELIERYVDFGLLEPVEASADRPMFAYEAIFRLRSIQRLRATFGVNANGVALILEMAEQLRALHREVERFRAQL